jgi:hypothetical protein
MVDPSLKTMFPVGVLTAALTIATKVTGWLKTEGLTDELKVVTVAPRLTTWFKDDEVLEAKLLSPL